LLVEPRQREGGVFAPINCRLELIEDLTGVLSFLASTSLIDTASMIERYSDHAANERTFLAWVRTAIATMAFGFLVEKFDLFLRIAGAAGGAPSATTSASRAGARAVPGTGQFVGDVAGLLLILLGGAMMAFAALRFRKTARDIDAREVVAGPGARADYTLAALLLLLGAALFVYLVYTVLSRV
jgi:putative membrane protein